MSSGGDRMDPRAVPVADDRYLFTGSASSSSASHPLRPYVDWNASKKQYEESLNLQTPTTAQSLFDLATLDGSTKPVTGAGDILLPGSSDQNGERALLLLKSYSLGLGLRFFTNALAQPFEVGKIIAQVQWVPGEGVEDGANASGSRQGGLGGDEYRYNDNEISDEDDAAAYFQDLQAKPKAFNNEAEKPGRRGRRDDNGYLLRDSVYDGATRPEWVMPIPDGGRVGVWESMRVLCGMQTEGLTSLWKGQLASFFYDILIQALVPIVESSLNAAFSLPDPLLIPLQHLERPLPNLMTLVAASTLVGCFLSPLDLVRTRLIVQSRRPERVQSGARRKYTGPLSGLRLTMKEEGGLLSLLFSPLRLVPTILCHVATSMTSNAMPLLIERRLRMNKSVSPIQYGLVELVLNTAQMLVVLPFETVLRRLQIQGPVEKRLIQGSDDQTNIKFKTCVTVRPKVYTGVFDALYSIVREEGRRPRTNESKTATTRQKKSSVGLRGLYRGFGMGLSANLMVFVLGLTARDQEGLGQWEEI